MGLKYIKGKGMHPKWQLAIMIALGIGYSNFNLELLSKTMIYKIQSC
jgi:hypothetical protein